MAGEDEKKCLEGESGSAEATTTTVTAKDKIKQFERVNSQQKVVSMEKQRQRAKFESRLSKFQKGEEKDKMERQNSATDVKSKASYFRSVSSTDCAANKEKEVPVGPAERKESIKTGIVADSASKFSRDERREQEEKARAEEEKVRKESFQRMKSGFEGGEAVKVEEVAEEVAAEVAATEQMKAEEEKARKESFKEKAALFQ